LVGDWTKIGIIDSENGRGNIYSDFGDYNIINLKPPFTPELYIEAIRALENAGMEAIIIDSTSHEWEGEGGCLQLNEKLAIAKYKGNTWSAWSETTPRHQKFLDAITSSSSHIITTVRNKVETVMGEDKKVKKVGTKEVQREGFEYELTVNFNIDRDTHMVIASKDNTQLFEGKDPFIITEKTGEILRDWVMSGAVDTEAKEKEELMAEIKAIVLLIGKEMNWLEAQTGALNNKTSAELSKIKVQMDGVLAKVNAKNAEKAAAATQANDGLKKSAAKHIIPSDNK